MLFRGSSPAALLQVCDVAVTFVVHLPGFTEDPASFDVCCQEIEVEVSETCYPLQLPTAIQKNKDAKTQITELQSSLFSFHTDKCAVVIVNQQVLKVPLHDSSCLMKDSTAR